ncbi:Paraflagellar rod protein 2 [Trypanosoma cruzi]|uniref:Paraflagellar rod protein 2 n=1 Tax=Trypanosoma cruzi TaxID=5693 RepID=A0A2V2V845_TRYCR|nr:Paraflagellar rod protein 2 [Trypanosoma cruzi]
MSYKEASGAVGPADQQQPAVPEVTDVTLEAARKQKIHNLKLKTSCLSNEEFIQDLHVSDWSETQKQKLLAAHEKAQELLSSVEGGTKWNLTEAYDIKKLMRVCGLQLSVRELYKPEDKPHFMEVVALKKTLNELKQHHNKTRTVSFTGTIDNAIAKLEKIEDELRRSQLDASEMAQVPVAVLKNLEECMNVTVVQTALLGNEEQIKAQLAAIEKAKEIRNVAIADGEMAIAEEQYYIKAQLLEHLVELVADKFRIIGQTEDENKPFGRIQDVQKKSFQETSAIKDAKRRLKQRCEDDLKNLHDAIQKADMEGRGGDEALCDAEGEVGKVHPGEPRQQDEAWRRIQELERVLQRLGTERFEEVKRRIEENDREEKRKVEYQQFPGCMWAAQEAAGAVGVQLRPGDAMHRDDGGAGGGGLQRNQVAPRQDERGAGGPAAAGASGVPGGVPPPVQDAGPAGVQEGEAPGGD